MSYLKSLKKVMVILAVSASVLIPVLLTGCGDQGTSAIFDPETGKHPSSWEENHGAKFQENNDLCTECHGDDLSGGISSVGCFDTSSNGTACHGSGIYHVATWDNPDLHGAAAKDFQAGAAGFKYCSTCHGADFNGAFSCFTSTCHTQGSPHSPAPWDGTSGSRMHMDTNVHNSGVCAQCHKGQAEPAPPAGTPVNCFTNTLCHNASAGHSGVPDWDTDHALTARYDTATCATASCHGTDLLGGSSGVGCTDCHLGLPPGGGAGMMHPDNWTNARSNHRNYGGNYVTSCGPAGVAQYCHGDGLPNDQGQLTAPPNGSWGEAPKCYTCHGKKW